MWELLERHRAESPVPPPGSRQPGPLPVPSVPAGTDLLPQIRHIVVLMMENHSYDNYLGMLSGRGEGLPLGPDGKPEVANPGPAARRPRAPPAVHGAAPAGVPSQSWHATHLQWGDGNCDGFVTSTQTVLPGADAAAVGMGYWTEEDLPFTTAWPGPSRSPTTGSVPAWGPPSPTAAS